MDKKRVMVLGAGRGQIGLIKAIKKDGHTCIVGSYKGKYPGFELADEVATVDISKPQEVSDAVKQFNADAIVTCCLDTGIAALGYSCDQNNLIGLSSKSAQISNDKFLMKQAFMDYGVHTARFKKVESLSDIEEIIKSFEFPMIVKAIDLQGSKGIYIANDESELYDSYKKTMSDTKKSFCIVEEFIVGDEFGAQSFVVNGEILYVMPTGDITYLSGTNIPIGHYVPLNISDEILDKTVEQVKLAIKAIGLDNCAVNVDLILKDGKIYVIELTGRVGANCLPELSSIYYGIDVYKMIYQTALGMDTKKYYLETKSAKSTPCYAKMLISEKSGTLKRIINNNDMENPNLYEIQFFVKEGDEVSKFTNSKDCLGQVVVKGESFEECEKYIAEVISNIIFEIE